MGGGAQEDARHDRGPVGWEKKVEKLREKYQPKAWHRQHPGAGESSDLKWQTQGPYLLKPRWAHIPGLGQSRAHNMRGLVCPLGTRWRGSTGEKPLNAWVGVLVVKSGVQRGEPVGLGWLGKVPEGGESRWALKEGRREEMREGHCRVGGMARAKAEAESPGVRAYAQVRCAPVCVVKRPGGGGAGKRKEEGSMPLASWPASHYLTPTL